MPRELKHQYKYRCEEISCRKIIRSDKWNGHCKSDHGYKYASGGEIKRTTIQVRDGTGPWTAVVSISKVRNKPL